MRNHAFLIASALVLTACSHSQNATTTTSSSTQPDSTVAQNDSATTQPAAAAAPSPDQAAGSSDDQSSTATNSAAASTATGAQCALLTNSQVEDAVHLTVRAVQVTSNPDACEFSFANQLTKVSIEFSTSGGKEEVDSTRTGAGGAQSIVGGIIDAAVGKNGDSSDAQAAKNLAVGTPPPDLPKVGDDQYAYSVGPLTSLVVAKGDEYVNVGITFPPDGVSRWQVLPELASRVLASH
jgi:hypothetical protein